MLDTKFYIENGYGIMETKFYIEKWNEINHKDSFDRSS